MNKPYLLFKNHRSLNWYAQIRLPDGTLSNNRSTGKESRAEAEKVVMGWIVSGQCPERISKNGNEIGSTSLEMITVFNQLKTRDLTDEEVDEIIKILKERKYIKSAVRPESIEARDVIEYLNEFWDMEKSPYLRELQLKGKSVPLRYTFNMKQAVKNHWMPIRALASIGYEHPEQVMFHAFRHEWCTNALSKIGDHRICMVGSGHKTDKIFAHYANHIQKDKALQTIAETSERIYADMLHSVCADDVDYQVIDESATTEQKLLPCEVVEVN